MKKADQLHALSALYSFYDDFAGGFSTACGPGCPVCCTPNVVVTSLEAEHLLSSPLFGRKPHVLASVRELTKKSLYRPTLTINHSAELCLARKDIPEDEGTHMAGRCILLDEKDLCGIYEHRPFACRAMSSRTACRPGKEADMEPFLVTVNLACYQIIEHLDRNGVTGSMPDVIAAVSGSRPAAGASVLRENRPLPGFMIPPDERGQFEAFLRRLSRCEVGTGCLGDFLPA